MRHTDPRSTGERIAQARLLLGLGALREPLGLPEASESAELDLRIRETLAWLPTVLDGGGRVAHWPGIRGRVGLTAESLMFLAEAEAAGFSVPSPLQETLIRTLKAGLRSDYGYFIDGESWLERSMALLALTNTGRFEDAYFAELSRNARSLGPEGGAQVLLAAFRADQGRSAAAKSLTNRLSDEIVVQLYQGEERYGGLASARTDRSPLIAPSESKTLATVIRSLQVARPDDAKIGLSIDALVRLGGADGWGYAEADAAALFALGQRLSTSPGADARIRLEDGGQASVITPVPGRSGPALHHHLGGPPGPGPRQRRCSGGPGPRPVDPGRRWIVGRPPNSAASWCPAPGTGCATTARPTRSRSTRPVCPCPSPSVTSSRSTSRWCAPRCGTTS